MEEKALALVYLLGPNDLLAVSSHSVSQWSALIGTAWAFGAVWFDAPFGSRQQDGGPRWFAIAFVVILVFVRPFWRKPGVFAALFAGVLIWWLTIKPTQDADWQPDVAQLGRAEVNGDEVTLHNVRKIATDRTETDYTARWETRAVGLRRSTRHRPCSQLLGLSVDSASPIVSFQLGDVAPICFSIETRKKVWPNLLRHRGLYRQFALGNIYNSRRARRDSRADELSQRRGHLSLSHDDFSGASPRTLSSRYVRSLNALRDKPRWYNAITTNCTTSIRTQHPPGERTRGTGAFCSMAKVTKCCMSAISSPPTACRLPNSKRAA